MCNEFAGPNSASLRPGNTAPFKEMSPGWRAVGNTVSDLTGTKFEPQTSRSRDERVNYKCKCILIHQVALISTQKTAKRETKVFDTFLPGIEPNSTVSEQMLYSLENWSVNNIGEGHTHEINESKSLICLKNPFSQFFYHTKVTIEKIEKVSK